MKQNERFYLYCVLNSVLSTKREIHKFGELLKQDTGNSSESMACLIPVMDEFAAISNNLIDVLKKSFDAESRRRELTALNVDDTKQLERLNHVMNNISRYIHQTADRVRPYMQAKVDDSDDPMFDFEIVAKIDYQLSQEDPEYDEDDDNYLSMRTEPLTRCRCEYDLNDDWRFSTTPEPFQHEPLSWLLHSLTEQDYGPEGPRVHLNDCLRIGQVHVDIKVWHQYIFDIKEGTWLKRRSGSEYMPVHVHTPY